MGLFSRGEKVRGWAQIVSTTRAPYQATSGVCKMQVIVQAEGVAATHVEATRICRVQKWPHAGMTLPCELDPRKPEDFKILWDEVESWEDQSRRQAAMMAQQMNQGGPGAGIPGMMMGAGNVQVVNLSGGEVDPAKIARVEQMLGVDLNGDGVVGAAPAAAAAASAPAPTMPPPAAAPASGFGAMPSTDAPGAADDRVAALERLAALKDRGLLTQAEFDAEKRRILGG